MHGPHGPHDPHHAQLKTGKVLLCSSDQLILFDLESKKKLTSL